MSRSPASFKAAAIEAAAAAPRTARPPAPRRSWVDALIGLIERLPVPAWAVYLALSLLLGACAVLLRWADGSVPFPAFNPVTVAFASLSVYPFAVLHLLNRVARRSLREFRPALGALEPRFDELDRRLTTMSSGAAIAALLIGLGTQAIGLIASGGGWGIDERTSVPTALVAILSQQLLNVSFAACVLRAIGQLRTIVMIHRASTGIRLWDRAPHDAFARFTFATAALLAVPFAVLEVFALVLDESSVLEVVLLVVVLLLSIAIFALPLSGMHRRLVEEKGRQTAQTDRGFELAAERLHRMLAAGDLAEAGAVNDALAALGMERERLQRISTWPWSAETLRGFVSSIAAPLLLWLATTVLDRTLGF